MSSMASLVTRVSAVCSTVCSGADQRKHQSSASLAFVRGIHRWPVDPPHKGPVTRKIFPFDDLIMVLEIIQRRKLGTITPTFVVSTTKSCVYFMGHSVQSGTGNRMARQNQHPPWRLRCWRKGLTTLKHIFQGYPQAFSKSAMPLRCLHSEYERQYFASITDLGRHCSTRKAEVKTVVTTLNMSPNDSDSKAKWKLIDKLPH